MINGPVIDDILKQVGELEKIRDRLMKNGAGGNLDPIFEKIEELYKKALKELGYDDDRSQNDQAHSRT